MVTSGVVDVAHPAGLNQGSGDGDPVDPRDGSPSREGVAEVGDTFEAVSFQVVGGGGGIELEEIPIFTVMSGPGGV